jgi:hypothetical protein
VGDWKNATCYGLIFKEDIMKIIDTVDTLPPAYCSTCGQRMIVSKELFKYDKYTGKSSYSWQAKCPHYHWWNHHAIYIFSENQWMWPGETQD